MSFRKVTVVLSGGGATALVKLSGTFDGVGKVKGECGGCAANADGKLWLIGDEIAEIELKRDKKTFETRLLALSDINCLLSTASATLTGGTGEKVDRLAVERRVEAYKKAKAQASAPASPAKPRETQRPARSADSEHSSSAATFTESERNGERQNSQRHDEPQANDSARESRRNEDIPRPRNTGRTAGNSAETTDVNVRSVLEEGVTYDGTNFFLAVKPQLDEMFVRYPAEERLNSIVPNSKWVRVDTDEGDYYVLGVLYDLSTPIYICYGIPGMRNVAPPREIADVCVWLPLSSDAPEGSGFWIIYQSAENGKCVR